MLSRVVGNAKNALLRKAPVSKPSTKVTSVKSTLLWHTWLAFIVIGGKCAADGMVEGRRTIRKKGSLKWYIEGEKKSIARPNTGEVVGSNRIEPFPR